MEVVLCGAVEELVMNWCCISLQPDEDKYRSMFLPGCYSPSIKREFADGNALLLKMRDIDFEINSEITEILEENENKVVKVYFIRTISQDFNNQRVSGSTKYCMRAQRENGKFKIIGLGSLDCFPSELNRFSAKNTSFGKIFWEEQVKSNPE